ncbi:hypothetical protein PI124_g4787 [Phytophthora idaei]|nr:hypothetical protein PI125_g2297 [Phytophthora idaei]KAG3165725.1 hypothetical protein PI126_g4480 [Phytophthora idaei]KAG3250555.1 hypothetical protein PI124_g4787 [Phytophthora idaei]
MSSPMKAPSQESAPADAATSVPIPADTTTSVSAHAGTVATESRLSVDEYHALQLKKRAQAKPDVPKTIIEGSSVWNTHGSMLTDYGPDISDVPMKDEEASSSTAESQSVVDTLNVITSPVHLQLYVRPQPPS